MVAIEDEGDRHAGECQGVAVVGIGVAAFDVDQARTPGVADAAGDRAESALVVVVNEAAREGRVEVAIAEPAVLALDADDPVRRELPVGAGLHAAEQAGAVVAEHEAVEIVAAAEGAAEMAADIEAGPVVDRRGIGRRLVVVGRARRDRRRGPARRRRRLRGPHGGEQELLHVLGLRKNRFGDTACGRHPWPRS